MGGLTFAHVQAPCTSPSNEVCKPFPPPQSMTMAPHSLAPLRSGRVRRMSSSSMTGIQQSSLLGDADGTVPLGGGADDERLSRLIGQHRSDMASLRYVCMCRSQPVVWTGRGMGLKCMAL